jgi:pyruvate dehydrogenase E2 component (dihydrolipoamide acetyltransferase)
MFGVKEFSAIINPPQACILAVGGPQERCVERDGRWVKESYMNVRLSADNRAVDEETAAHFLESFQFHIENPALLMS